MPAPGYEAFGEPTSYPGKSTTSKGSNSGPNEAEHANKERLCYLGPEINVENLNWRVINGPFISVWLHNVPWGAEDTLAAPDAKVSFEWEMFPIVYDSDDTITRTSYVSI